LSNQEHDILIQYLENDKSYFSIGLLLMLGTGIRIGELCALKNVDINIENQEIYINKTLQRIYDINKKQTKIVISSPKTLQSNRTIPIPKSLIPYLSIEKNNNYFLTQSTHYIEPRSFRYKFKQIVKKLQISEVTVHSLRHYFATQCIELGFDYNCLSEILGHSSPSTTMNLYVHCKNEHKKNCMNRIIF
jgi:integrase